MLSPQNRLRRNAHFQYAYRKGRSSANQAMKLVYVRSGPPSGIRVGFSVSKKIGNAVVRNRTKRRMRAAMRALLPQTERGYYLVFVAHPAAAQLTYWELERQMRALLSSVRLYHS